MGELETLGIAGWLSDEDRSRLADLDVDAVHALGLAGPLTPELLVLIAETGEHHVRDTLHGLGAAGAWEPEQLERLLSFGIDRAAELVHANGWHAESPSTLLRRLGAA